MLLLGEITIMANGYFVPTRVQSVAMSMSVHHGLQAYLKNHVFISSHNFKIQVCPVLMTMQCITYF